MTTSTMKSHLAKAARMILVFLLVFWGSFRVETLAFAESESTTGTSEKAESDEKPKNGEETEPSEKSESSKETGSGEKAKDVLTDLTVYKVDTSGKDGKDSLGDEVASIKGNDGKTKEEEKKAAFSLKPGESVQFVAIPTWDKTSNGSKTSIDDAVTFVKWTVEPEKSVNREVDKKTGRLTVTAPNDPDDTKEEVSVTVTCALSDVPNNVDTTKLPKEGKDEIKFVGELLPHVISEDVSGLLVYDANHQQITEETPFPSKFGDSYSYEIGVRVRVIKDDEESYKPDKDSYYDLVEARNAGVKVTWSIIKGGDLASINSESGAITFSEAGRATVSVKAQIGKGGEQEVSFVVVKESEGSSGGTGGDGKGGDGTGGDGTGGDGTGGDGTDGDGTDDDGTGGDGTGDDGTGGDSATTSVPEPVTQGDPHPQTTLQVSVPNARVVMDDGEPTDGDSQEGATGIDKTYTAEELEALGTANGTYTMYHNNEFTTVTGEGVYLGLILKDVGIEDTSQIASIAFEGQSGESVALNWDDLTAASFYYPNVVENQADLTNAQQVEPLVAINSLVRGYGDGTGVYGEPEEPSSEESSSSSSDEGGDSKASSSSSESESSSSKADSKGTADSDGSDSKDSAKTGDAVNAGETDKPGEVGDAEKQNDANNAGDAGDGKDDHAGNQDSDGKTSGQNPQGDGNQADKGLDDSSPINTQANENNSNEQVKLSENTRFRLLFGSTSPARDIADPDALRYINKITVTLKPHEEEKEDEPEDPGYDTPIGVSVEYVPVPIGAPAIFMALPNTEIKNARFDFTWEFSADGGKSWEPVENGNVQGLRVVTTKERVEKKYQYRVIMETDATDNNGRENVKVTSDSVTMVEGNGLAVVLEYDPPIAGQTAYFQTTLYGAKEGVEIKYTWQQSQDGGANWTDIAGRTGSTLAVPTEPIDPNAPKSDSDEVVPITYVRVIAEEQSGDKRVAVSEAVPLTVHVGDEETKTEEQAKPVVKTEPEETPKDEEKKEQPKPKPKQVTPVKDIVVEEPDEVEEPDDIEETPTVPKPEGELTQQIDPSQLYINDEVTELVNEQQEAVEEYRASNVPGARWTSLSSPQASNDDVHRILADNPFAPFVFPVSLGFTVAGGLEKLLAFRRQVK